jgi:hypothetical protein
MTPLRHSGARELPPEVEAGHGALWWTIPPMPTAGRSSDPLMKTTKRKTYSVMSAFTYQVGYHTFNSDLQMNFTLNRFWNWVGEDKMLEELKR